MKGLLNGTFVHCWNCHALFTVSLPPATKLGQGNIFRSICQEFCPGGGGHAWQGGAWQGGTCLVGGVHGRGDVHGKEACVARGHAWRGACMIGGACVAGMGACMAGGMHGKGGCAWQGGHGLGVAWWGGGMCGKYYEILSMNGQYASYWNAFLFECSLIGLIILIC